jgi:hypothetical protein
MISVFHELTTLMSQAKVGAIQEVHLIWTIREASMFDIFAKEILPPLCSGTEGVYVHLYITGGEEFVALSPDMMAASLKANSSIQGLEKNCHRSIMRSEKEKDVESINATALAQSDHFLVNFGRPNLGPLFLKISDGAYLPHEVKGASDDSDRVMSNPIHTEDPKKVSPLNIYSNVSV